MDVGDELLGATAFRSWRCGVFGGAPVSPLLAEFCQAMGRELGKQGSLRLVTGGFGGFRDEPNSSPDWHVIDGFLAAAGKEGPQRIQTLLADPVFDDSRIQRFSRGIEKTLYGKGTQARRFATVNHVDAFATINADEATRQMIELAVALGKPVLPLPSGTSTVERDCWTLPEDSAHFTRAFYLSPDDVAWLSGLQLGRGSIQQDARRTVALLLRALRRRCFVIMKYDCHEDVYRDAIVPALTATGYAPIRAKDVAHVDDAVLTLQQALHSSDLVIALLDDASLNVAYEIGIAHALGKPVVLVSLDESLPTRLPFDLRNRQICTAPDVRMLHENLLRFIRGSSINPSTL